jgi:hypothetical protein
MRSGLIVTEIRSHDCRAGPVPNKNIENNPMHSREPLANKRIKNEVVGMDALPAKTF